MRWKRSFFVLGICLIGLAARPVDDGPAGPPVPAHEKLRYLNDVEIIVGRVAERYFRPLERKTIAKAAALGLYEAARMPMPTDLARDFDAAEDDADWQRLLASARDHVGDDPILRGQNALLASVQGITRILDPHSLVISGDELRRGRAEDQSFGVGLEVSERSGRGPVVVTQVDLGGPAQRAGIRPGDHITHVGGKSVRKLASVQAMFQRPPEPRVGEVAITEVPVTVWRPEERRGFEHKLAFATYRTETVLGVSRRDDHRWDFWVDRGQKIAHVRLARLSAGTRYELAETLAQLEEEGMKGLILDLRWCPGGFLNEAIMVAELFLGDVSIATIHNRGGERTEHRNDQASKSVDVPMVVLVNGASSGGAELIAAALQDHRRALVVGQRTLGKASIQHVEALPIPNCGLKLTGSMFVRPNGGNLHRHAESKPDDEWGVRPDREGELPISAELSTRIGTWWTQQSLRPGSSKQALPLDDPEADPQRQHAVKVLRERLRQEEFARAAD